MEFYFSPQKDTYCVETNISYTSQGTSKAEGKKIFIRLILFCDIQRMLNKIAYSIEQSRDLQSSQVEVNQTKLRIQNCIVKQLVLEVASGLWSSEKITCVCDYFGFLQKE